MRLPRAMDSAHSSYMKARNFQVCRDAAVEHWGETGKGRLRYEVEALPRAQGAVKPAVLAACWRGAPGDGKSSGRDPRGMMWRCFSGPIPEGVYEQVRTGRRRQSPASRGATPALLCGSGRKLHRRQRRPARPRVLLLGAIAA